MMDAAKIITRDELKRVIENKGSYVLIDVREKEELAYGMIPTAKNVPLDELENALQMRADDFEKKYGFSKPGKNDRMIFHCRTGGRSARATQIAHTQGFLNVQNYKGSIWDWSEIDPNVRKYGPTPVM